MESWNTLYIYYFSGTGNARLASAWIADEAERSGKKAVIQQIDRLENITFPDPDEKVLIGFAYPTHGFNAAPIMLKFIAGFPSKLCPEIFLLNTRGGLKLGKTFLPGLSGLASLLPALMLRLKGYSCIGYRPVDLPSNWVPLHPGLKTKVIESIIARWEIIVRKFAGRILSGRKVFRGLYSLPVDLLIAPVAIGYYLGGRFFLSKTFIASYKCNNCGLCIKECPTSSIVMVRNRPYWKLSCESCMRCLNHCPKKAIEAAHGMAALIMIAIISADSWITLSLSGLLHFQPEVWWWKVISMLIWIFLTIGISAVIYFLMHYAMGLKPIKYLLRFTSLTSLPFWRRYVFLKGKKHVLNSNDKLIPPDHEIV